MSSGQHTVERHDSASHKNESEKQEKDEGEPIIQQFNFTEPTESVLNNEELDEFLEDLEHEHSDNNLNESKNSKYSRGGMQKLDTNSSTIEAMKSEIL